MTRQRLRHIARVISPLVLGMVAVVFLAFSPAHAEQRTFQRVWEYPRETDFSYFLGALGKAVRARDAAALGALMADDVRGSLQGQTGVAETLRAWDARDPQSRLWRALDRILLLGGTTDENGVFRAPSTSAAFPREIDRTTHFVTLWAGALMRAAPNPASAIVARAPFAIVQFVERSGDWVKVRWGEREGWMLRGDLISPIGPRMEVRRYAQGWRIVSLVEDTVGSPSVSFLLDDPAALDAERTYPPYFEYPSDPGFPAFLSALTSAVRRRDADALGALMAVDISYGQVRGPARMVEYWEARDPQSRVWTELELILRLGGMIVEANVFYLPHTVLLAPEDLDQNHYALTTSDRAVLRAEPHAAAPVLAVAPYALVRILECDWEACGSWAQVSWGGHVGWISDDELYVGSFSLGAELRPEGWRIRELSEGH